MKRLEQNLWVMKRVMKVMITEIVVKMKGLS